LALLNPRFDLLIFCHELHTKYISLGVILYELLRGCEILDAVARKNQSTSYWLPPVTTVYYGLAIVHCSVRVYLWDMANRNVSQTSATETKQISWRIAAGARKRTPLLRSTLRIAGIALALVATSMAAELPEAPSASMRNNAEMIEATPPVQGPKFMVASQESRMIDTKFVSFALISTGSTFADSYTTLFARQNWLAGKKGVCNVEVQSAYLYGTHPTVARAYAVASVKSASSVFAAYYLRKHHNRFWSLPLVTNSIISLEGVGQNMATCN
jgi:hypothetical protein